MAVAVRLAAVQENGGKPVRAGVAVEQARCDCCGEVHPDHLKRWMCMEGTCGKVMCLAYAMDGKPFGRKGSKVHVKVRVDPKTGKPTRNLFLCGVLEPVDDMAETSADGPAPEANTISESTLPTS